MSIKSVSVPTKTLSVNLAANATGAVLFLNNIKSWSGVDLVAGDFGTQAFAVLRNAANTVYELIEIDPATVASSSITILKRGLGYSGAQVANAVTSYDFTANDTFCELGSSVPQLLANYVDKATDQTISGLITFVQNPVGLNPGAAADASTTVKGLTKMSVAPASATSPIAVGDNDTRVPTQGENDALVGTSGTPSSSNKYVTDADARLVGLPVSNIVKFGGTGADGALTISSGTTTINCANAKVVIKNYSSISITATGKLAFSNPNSSGTVVILKSVGAVTLTSSTAPMIDMSAMGAAPGAIASVSGNTQVAGNGGTTGNAFLIQTGSGGGAPIGSVGSAGAAPIFNLSAIQNLGKYPDVFVGAGGGSGDAQGSGSGGPAASGVPGIGGGALIIECGGAWNFTTASGISVAGQNAADATGIANMIGAGSGGGGGGYFKALYNTLTANSGTVTVSGGVGSKCTGSGSTAYGGGGGAGFVVGTVGTSSGSTGTKTGGDGGVGASLVALNTEYV